MWPQRARTLDFGADMNQPVYIPGQSTLGNSQQRRPLPSISQALELRSEGNSIYNSFQASVRHRMKSRLDRHLQFHGIEIDRRCFGQRQPDSQRSSEPGAHPVQSAGPPRTLGFRYFAQLADFLRVADPCAWKSIGEPDRLRCAVERYLDAGCGSSLFGDRSAGNSLSAENLDNADQVPGVSPFLVRVGRGDN